MSDYIEKLKKEVMISEAYITALFWNDPTLYTFYPEEKINSKSFMNTVYAFFFSLGRKAYEDRNIKIFDDISVYDIVEATNTQQMFEKFGGLETIREIQEEVVDKEDNLDAYYGMIKKYVMLRKLYAFFGDAVFEKNGKYDYHHMTKEAIHTYWNDKINNLAMDGDNKYEEEHLLKGLKQRKKNWNENPAVGLPFYKSKKMTKITTGWDYGHVYIFGGFGGSGKTSVSFNKVIMSCIEQKEKVLVIANEQSTDDFAKLAVITGMGNGYKPKRDKDGNILTNGDGEIEYERLSSIQRQRINEGGFTKDEDKKMDDGIDYLLDLSQGDDELVTFVFMENYIMDDVKKIVRHYAARGVRRVIIDTARPSDSAGGAEVARWERFVEDFKEIYKLARPNGGGLNLAVWANVQLADAALNRRFLNEHAFGDSKKIKNEASVVFMFRHVWDDEFEGGKNALTVINHVSNPLNDKKYEEVEFKLKKSDLKTGEQYLLLFTSKNRRGQDNKTGQPVLVLKGNFNRNQYTEIGFTTVSDDKNY